MPELPEIFNLAGQMDQELRGRKVAAVEVRQSKCLNTSVEQFQSLVEGKAFAGVRPRGKWVIADLEPGALFLLSLGMGGDVVFHQGPQDLPSKYQVRFDFEDGSVVTMGFWWFGYAHAVPRDAARTHKMTAELGLDPLDSRTFTFPRFSELLRKKRGAVKPVLMDQRCIAGIGNVYIQDILFKAGLHPDRPVPSISEVEMKSLYTAVVDVLSSSARVGGLAYEKDLYGRPGGFKAFLVGYREGKPCPVCGSSIIKIKTGSTSSFVCPSCQK
ncbi:MAG: Fpg/Nei family DNA glycosylase [Bacillota bacterium]